MGIKFDEQSAERIAATVKWVERSVRNEGPQRKRQAVGVGNFIRQGLLDADGTISARSGNTPGSGTITLQYFDGTDLQSDEDVTVYNPYWSEITVDGTNDLPVQVAYGDGGQWWLVGVDCEDA